ncbi:MAG: hypothetical protein KGR26_12865, partial [Cyanobacteria bacterium REEB65]|nr:hypothetical protein [Cyanobacteria bacterium REEB65]
MTAAGVIIEAAERAGIRLAVEGDSIVALSGADKLTPELRETIQAAKPALLRELGAPIWTPPVANVEIDGETARERAVAVAEIVTPTWPDPLSREALHGLAGDIVRTIEPHTEADPAALLFQFLVAFGNAAGRSAHFVAEADRHFTNAFVALVGTTSKGRKGTSWGHVRRLFDTVDPDWAQARILSGLSSGEGLIAAVCDPIERQEPVKKEGRVVGYETVVENQGVTDKRLLVIESEFASTLRVLAREGNTLSPVLRNAWDRGDLATMTKTPLRATGAHVSIISHVTKDELLRTLRGTETGNGFANRFVWVCARRSKCLPEGGRISEVDFAPLVLRLREALTFAASVGELRRDANARAAWGEVYPDLSEGKPGLLGAVTGRAEAQVMRFACLYALLDRCAEVKRQHLAAGLALWEYAEASARFIFGDSLGDPVADEILRSLRAAPEGLT